MKKILTFLVLLTMFVGQALAQEFEIAGIKYSGSQSGTDGDGNPIYKCRVIANNYSGDITIPAKVLYNEEEYSVTLIGYEAFKDCSSLTSITIPEGVTSIGSEAFYGCSSLTSITIPESVTSIESYAFYGCSSLTSITIPKGVTSIGNNAFCYCSFLTSITIPESVTSIGSGAFQDCSSLASITFDGATPPSGCGDISAKVAFVPEAAIAAYQAALTRMSASAVLAHEAKDKQWAVVCEAQDAGSDLRSKLNAAGVSDELMTKVIDLKITGTINSYDFVILRDKMVNLLHLDLSEARIVENAYVYYTDSYYNNSYHTENDKFPAYAFSGKKLFSCLLPQDITTIGQEAFNGTNLTEIIIPSKVTSIGDNAFSSTKLQSVVFPEGLQYIGSDAFYDCRSLREIKFPSTLLKIGASAFGCCSSLQEVKFPSSLNTIGNGAFYGCSSLKEVRLPSSIEELGGSAFAGCKKLTKVYTYTIEPLSITEDVFSTGAYNGTLYVPETAYENYYFGEGSWKKFLNLMDFNEPYEYFYLNKDFTMGEETPRLDGVTDEETGETTPPDADLNEGSGLIVKGDEVQELDSLVVKDDGNGTGGSIIGGGEEGKGNITAKKLNIKIQITGGKWYFFAFPFDITLSKIKYDGNYVWRYYDGGHRAEHGSGAWKDVSETKLERGKGYIFQGDKSGTLSLVVEDVDFNSGDWKQHLDHHASDEAHNAGWNFVGNPHTSYFDIQDMGYDHPVTIWNPNNNTYEAITPQDDDHVFHPYQAFFVQKPNGTSEITFEAEHRKTKTQKENNAAHSAAKRRIKSAAASLRKVVNLTISNADGTDKTRVVFNPESSATYDAGQDAAKFLAAGVPQLYSLDAANVQYAINERPAEEGIVPLGFTAPAEGSYTISATRADVGVMLKDKLTGNTHDLSKSDYSFLSEAGTFSSRFLLMQGGSATGINGVHTLGAASLEVAKGKITIVGAEGLHTTVVAANGAVVGELFGNGEVNVATGVYMVTVGGETQKVIVK